MRRLVFSLFALCCASFPAAAQSVGMRFVTSCGTATTTPYPGMSIDASGNLCVTGGSNSGALSTTATSAGGQTVARVIASAGTNATTVKNAPGRIYSYSLCNTAASARYVRFFNLATPPTPGTSPVYAGATAIAAGLCQPFSNDIGLSFSVGIGIDITGAPGDADTTAVSAGDVQGFIGYQ